MTEIERLIALSEKATQGGNNFSESVLLETQFRAALAEWFRANQHNIGILSNSDTGARG